VSTQPPPGGSSESRALRIVHLEDDVNDAQLVREMLSVEGFEFEILNASTRQRFVESLEQGQVDLILSDYALPGFDGLSALAVARRLVPDVPFILLSGTLGEEAAIESLRSGATDYVLKHRLNRLVPAVRRAIEEARERRIRREAEGTLERERGFLRAVLDSLEAGVVACDQHGILTLLNRASRELHGLPAEPLPPEQWAAHYRLFRADGKTPMATNEIPLRRALHGEKVHHEEMTILHRSGTAHIVSCSGQPIVDEVGVRHGAVVSMVDVTERKQLERQFQQAQKMEAMGKLAAGVAHDFNNLLTVISGYCQLAISRLKDPHPARRDLEQISRASDRATNLTRQLLAFSRQQVLEMRRLDLNHVIADMEKMLRRLIGADVELEFAPHPDVGPIRADAGQIEQVLMNMIVNARDAMPEGGRITIATSNLDVQDECPPPTAHGDPGGRILVEPETPPGRYVVLRVDDSGCGMDAETASRIFEPFFTTKSADRGTGLGLSTVHGIVTQSGGHIRVRSEIGRGTSFQILLPRAEEETESTRPKGARRLPIRGTEAILVVDDDVALLGLVSEILRLQGYTVVQASDGESAWAILEDARQEIHAMVTDVVMPKMSGRALAERVLDVRPEMAVIFMSGYVGENIDTLGSLIGPRVAFVQKPFDPDVLLGRLREALDASSSEAA
jgi:hypothetical protein